MNAPSPTAARHTHHCLNVAAGAAVAVVTFLVCCATGAGAVTPTERLTAAQFVAQIKMGAPIDYTGLEISGSVNLSPLHDIHQAIRCRDCHVDGNLLATDVTFAKSIDLENVTIGGRLEASGAVFDGPMLARGPNSRVTGDVDLSFAQFTHSSAFDGLSFMGLVSFEGAVFDGTATFTGTTFDHAADFDRVHFTQGLDFGGSLSGGVAYSHGDTTFRLADFGGPVDFGQRVFGKGLSLNHARADDAVSVADTQVWGSFNVEGALLTNVDAKKLFVKGPASLFSTHLQNISLNASSFGCSLDLRSATVTGRATLRNVVLTPIAQSRTTCPAPGELLLDDFSSGQLSMDRSLVNNAPGDDAKRGALHDIETFERTSGSVSEANDSHFQLLALDASHRKGLAAVEDWGYRQIGGYLVRPLRPLRALALVIIFASLLRWKAADRLHRRDPDKRNVQRVLQHATEGARRTVRFSGRHLLPFLKNTTTSLNAAFRPKFKADPPIADGADAAAYAVEAAKLVEYLISKTLLFAFVLSLANYNTTLHDLVKGLVPA